MNVLEAIDHAVEDWRISGDAMRWLPSWSEPVVHPPDILRRLTDVEGIDSDDRRTLSSPLTRG